MADLRCTIAGITSPNPFWLASAPPTDKAYNVNRAFEAGWGGVVWKTLGLDPHVVNVSSRYGAVQWNGQRIAGLNNIELITDRPLDGTISETISARSGQSRLTWAISRRFTSSGRSVISSMLFSPAMRWPFHCTAP